MYIPSEETYYKAYKALAALASSAILNFYGLFFIQFEHSRDVYTFRRNVLQSLQSSRSSRFVRHLEFLWFVLKRDTRIAPCILIG